MLRELELRSIPSITQQLVQIEYKGLVFDQPLRFDIMVESCLLLELKAVEALHPFSRAQLFSYMKLLDIPIGLPINFHEPVLKNGISRMILPGANRTEENEDSEVSFSILLGRSPLHAPSTQSRTVSCLRTLRFLRYLLLKSSDESNTRKRRSFCVKAESDRDALR